MEDYIFVAGGLFISQNLKSASGFTKGWIPHTGAGVNAVKLLKWGKLILSLPRFQQPDINTKK
jgi:hypothetical protein